MNHEATYESGPIHLTPTERYFRGEISLDEATRGEIAKMSEERLETRFGPVNVAIRLIVVVIALPFLILSLLNPRRYS